MSFCDCIPPLPGPEREGFRNHLSCRKCGRLIDEEILSSDQNLRAFFDDIARALPAITPAFHDLRFQCELREHAGRGHFGLKYLARDNLAEGREEEADGLTYIYLDLLRCQREGWDEDRDLAQTEAYHLYKAYEANRRRAERRRGSP